jgi:hypothetical protein
MTEIHVVEESIYLQSDSDNDVYVPPPSVLLDDTHAPANCTYGIHALEIPLYNIMFYTLYFPFCCTCRMKIKLDFSSFLKRYL